VTVVAVSYDAVDVLTKFAEKQTITYPLLSDPGGKTIAAYGLSNRDAKGKFEGIPYPGTMIVDAKGVIRAKLFHDGFVARHTAEQIVKAAGEIKD
jgi:peroxiredoxin Q/BCP